MLADFPYFTIKYDDEFENLLIILYDKSKIVFF